jgi:hypothetical protein
MCGRVVSTFDVIMYNHCMELPFNNTSVGSRFNVCSLKSTVLCTLLYLQEERQREN